MEDRMKNIIMNVLSKYWKPYKELEENIKELLINEDIKVDSVFLTGSINNMYLYIQNKNKLYVYNEYSDVSNALLLNQYNIKDVEFKNNIATINNFNYNLNNIPKVCLINMCVIENFPIPRLNLSTGAIAAYIREKQKARVQIIDMQLRIKIEDIEKLLKKEKFDIIAISISFGQKELSDRLINKIRSIENNKGTTIVVGNVIPSLYSNYYLKKHKGIIVSYREGEESFLDLIDYVLNEKKIEEVRGIAYINEKQEYKVNKINRLDITKLPFPAVDTIEDVFKYKGALTLELSRGCNYSLCTFCPRSHKGAKWRGLSVENMVMYFKTLEDICKKLGKEPFFYIADEEFIGQLPHDLELKRIEEFCGIIEKIGINVKFDVSARVDSIFNPNENKKQNIERLRMWKMLKNIGLQRLFLGVESGSDNQLKRFNKGTNAYQNATAIKLITALGINIRIGYISFDPLMDNFENIKESHKFVEREDILYESLNLDEVSLEKVYEGIVNEKKFNELKLQNKPLYYKISYPLTSLEVLFGTVYERKIKECEKKNNIKLITGIEMNMARYNSKYFNETIGKVSDCCQRWIDYNFPVMYSLKGLYKTSKECEKREIYNLMSWSKSIDHYLLNYLMYEIDEIEKDENLEKFTKLHNFTLKKFKGTVDSRLMESLNSWQKIEEIFIKKIEKMLIDNIIRDTDDLALTKSIENWNINKGSWKKINDREEKIEE